MCEQESHQVLNQSEHFIRHSMKVEQACAAFRNKRLGTLSIEQVIREADDALALVPSDTDEACLRMLDLAHNGILVEADPSV